LFIERHRPRDAIRVVHLMAAALRAGEPVAVFPEGTTSDGHGVLPFHANLLQAAISAGVPVQPIALRFSDASGSVSAVAAYIGEQTLGQSLWAVVSGVKLVACVTLLPPHCAPLPGRRDLASHIQRDITIALTAPP
jgi:1-acyl-sn-glycerol-3-phosphate acyltransferase